MIVRIVGIGARQVVRGNGGGEQAVAVELFLDGAICGIVVPSGYRRERAVIAGGTGV